MSKFKIGDKVKIVDTKKIDLCGAPEEAFAVGTIATVQNIDNDLNTLINIREGNRGFGAWAHPSQLEKVKKNKIKVGKKYILKDLNGAVSGFYVGDIVRVKEEIESSLAQWKITAPDGTVGYCNSSSLMKIKGNIFDLVEKRK
jgi:hypothetical protein